MNKVVIINADDGKEWAKFLSSEIKDLTKVDLYNVNALGTNYLRTLDLDLVCIILTPHMLEKKKFINSTGYLKNPLIILCGVSRREMEGTACCNSWMNCQMLTVTSDKMTTSNFKGLIYRTLQDWNSNHLKLIPDTLVKKANQSCVLIFSKPFRGTLDFEIDGYRDKLVAEMNDSKTIVINVPDLPEGKHTLLVFGNNKKIPIELSLTIVDTNANKCGCKYIYKMLNSNDLQPLDELLVTYMENDYSNRLFYQHISNPNPEISEFPTALHFAVAHRMHRVLEHLMNNSFSKEALAIKNDKDMNCFDIARRTRYSGLVEKYIDEPLYLDMTRGNPYATMSRI